MSKYKQLRDAMGGVESYNDSTTTGRVLKWESDMLDSNLEQRKALADSIYKKLIAAGILYVQKVVVRMSRDSAYRGCEVITFRGYDKICVHVERI